MAYQTNKTYVLFSHGGAGRCLTVYGGVANNNQNVCLFRQVGTTAQNWTIKAFGSNLKLVTGLNQNYALNYYWSAGQGKPGNCDIYPQAGNDADSSIILEPVCTDVYRIKLKNYGLYLTAKNDSDSADVRWEKRVVANLQSDPDETTLAPQLWRFVDTSAKGIRAPFIFAGYSGYSGPDKYSYTDTQLDGLNNATEFVVCSGGYQEYFQENGVPNTQMIEYMKAAVARAKSLYDKYHKQIWIGTPMIASPVKTAYNKYAVPLSSYDEIGRRMTYFVDNVITECRSVGLDFNTCVKGFYMAEETVHDSPTGRYTVDGHPQIKMFQTMSTYVAGKGKKMLWSPHWSSDNLFRAGQIIHRTDIFDYVLMQPNYFFCENNALDWQPNWNRNCEAIRNMVKKQRICYQLGTPAVLEKDIVCSKTRIGCQMEIDRNYGTTSSKGYKYADLYKHYTDVFGATDGAFTKFGADFGFYLDCASAANFETLKAKANEFFQ